ncbi:MAG TPA: GerAB/ArcD/ProY family transporter [Bacillota bacterium]|nr:GerAB/ArcD/ProY family transporter [Bacillota bacterium]
MNNPLNKVTLSDSALFATLLVALMGANFLDLPYGAARYGGPSGYWSVGIAFILFIPVVFLAIALHKRFPDQNLFEVAPEIIGKPLAFIGNLLFLAPFFVQLVLALRDGSDLNHLYLLNQTPLWAVVIVILFCVGYVTLGGLSSIVRFMNFLLIPNFILRLIMEILTFQTMKATHLLPLFSETPGRYLIGGLLLNGYFLPVTAVFLLSNRIKKPAKFGPAIFGALGGIFPIYLLAFIGTVGNFGAEYTQSFAWSEVVATNHINIPYLILEQVGLIFLILWITTFFATMTLVVYTLGSGLKSQIRALNYRWTVVGVLAVAGVGAMLFPNSIVVREAFTAIRPWLMLPVTVYPILVYLVAVMRGIRGGLQNEA